MTSERHQQGLLDTNIIILRRWIDPSELPEEMAISAVTLAELSAGPHQVRRNDEQNDYDGMIPSDMATGSTEQIEEERRLFYVALTRARDRLSVYFPMRLYYRRAGRGDRYSFAQPTRFLTPEVLATMERDVRYDEITPDVPRPQLPRSVESVDSLLQDLLGD